MKASLPRSLFAKAALSFVAVVAVPLLLLGGTGLWFSAHEQRATVDGLLKARSDAAAERIAGFVTGIQDQLAWATHLPWDAASDLPSHRRDALRVLRQAPAITDLALLDGDGRERLTVSRLALDRVESGAERGTERAFVEALARRVYHGPVSFRRETEPFMTLAVAGPRREMGVAIAEVNLKFVWDVVSAIRVGEEGRAWVADARGRLLAHPDMSFVLSNPDVARRVEGIVGTLEASAAEGRPVILTGLRGERVQAAHAIAQPMGWHVVLELPEREAQAPLWRSVERALWVALGSCVLAVAVALVLARRLVRPIRTLSEGASQLGSGALDARIDVRTGDELEALGRQFNTMAEALQASYAGLERKVAERTRALAEADAAKTRFLAAASHDLRQPLHALNLLVAQMRQETDDARRRQASERIESALADINALFDGLLDLSRLDAGTVRCEPRPVPLAPLLARVRDAFVADAAAKGIRLHVACDVAVWVRSDPQLLERVLLNLVGNAVRFTPQGGVMLAARHAEGAVRLQVRDSGVGIDPAQQERVFDEYVQLGGRPRLGGEGLGLGLAIVKRLAKLLGHPLSLRSAPGRGTCFELRLARVAPSLQPAAPPLPQAAHDWHGRCVLTLDDDLRVQDSMAGLLQAWGCRTVCAESYEQAVERLDGAPPALVIADLHLRGGELGSTAVLRLREHFGDPSLPAMLVSGDVGPASREAARAAGLHLLDKPVQPMALRALGTRLMAAAAKEVTA